MSTPTRAESAATTVGPVTADTRLTVLYRPTWVADGEAISAYCARVIRVDGALATPVEGPKAYPPDDPVSALAIDRVVTAAAVRDLAIAARGGRAASVIVPLAWSSLAPERRSALMALFADLEPELRKTRLSVEVFAIPNDASPDAVQDMVGFLDGLCGKALLRVRLASELPCRAEALDGVDIGLDLAELSEGERMTDERLLELLARLRTSADRAGAGCYLWSARRRRVVGEVVAGGFEMVNGPGLMKDVGRPAVVVPAPRHRFVSNDG